MFPIFKLPFVALRQILDTFEFKDLVLLSFCSSRTCQILKMTRSMTIGLELQADCVDGIIYVALKGRIWRVLKAAKQDSTCITSKGTVKIREMTLPLGEVQDGESLYSPRYMAPFWNDPVLGFQTIMEYLRDLFRVDIHTIGFGRNTFWIVDWIQQRQNGVQRAYTESYKSWSSEEYDNVLKTCKARELDLNSIPGDDFQYTGGLEGRERIDILYGKWITLEILLEINVPDIKVGSSHLTNNDVNQLLKKWLAGGLPKLKYLYLYHKKTHAGEILDGLNVEAKPVRTYKRYGWNHEFKENKELQRCDGATASIIVTPSTFTFALWPHSND